MTPRLSSTFAFSDMIIYSRKKRFWDSLGPDSLSGILDSDCLDSVRIFLKKYFPMSFCPDFVCLDSVRCQDSVRIFRKKTFRCLSVRTLSVSILSAVRILSGFLEKTLSAVCLSGRARTRQSCPDFRCPCPPTSAQTGNRTRAAWVKARNPNP